MVNAIEDIIVPHLRTVTEPLQLVLAIKSKLAEYDSLEARIAELQRATQGRKLPERDDPSQFSDEESEGILKLASDVGECNESRQRLALLQDILIAQYFFIRNLRRIEIIEELTNWPSSRVTNISACVEWIRSDFEDTKKGEDLFQPFQCDPGPLFMRNKRENEYYILRMFLYHYSLEKGQAFQVIQKGEKPDFIVQCKNNTRIGIEVTLSGPNQWIKNYKKCAPILRRSSEVIYNEFGKLIAFDPSLLDGNWGFHENDLANKCREFLSGNQQKQSIGNLKVQKISSSISLTKNDIPYFGNYFEDKNAEFMIERIKNKIGAKQPDIRPCFLVLFPFWKFGIYHHDVLLKSVQKEIATLAVASHFDEIWYIYEGNQKAYRITP